MTVLEESAPAKVNFALDIVGRRDDGYHEMRMINHCAALTDTLTFTEGQDIQLICSDRQVPLGEDNLIVSAALRMKVRYQVDSGAVIRLEKKIPMQAGLGGGSADAAAAIRGLNRLWQLNLSEEEMRCFGAEIGADVPYCISGGTALVEGFGERITFLKPLPEIPMLILKPAIHISTPDAFRMADVWQNLMHPKVFEAAACIDHGAWKEAVGFSGNSFEAPIFARWSLIEELKQSCLKSGAVYAVMSGSGSTVAAYFSDQKTAEQAACQINIDGVHKILSVVQTEARG